MKQASQDFMVDIVNTEPLIGVEEKLLIMLAVFLAAMVVIWWVRKK